MDIDKFLFKYVEVELTRHKKTRVHRGVLVAISGRYIQLKNNDGRFIWMRRPDHFKDSMKEVKPLKLDLDNLGGVHK